MNGEQASCTPIPEIDTILILNNTLTNEQIFTFFSRSCAQ